MCSSSISSDPRCWALGMIVDVEMDEMVRTLSGGWLADVRPKTEHVDQRQDSLCGNVDGMV